RREAAPPSVTRARPYTTTYSRSPVALSVVASIDSATRGSWRTFLVFRRSPMWPITNSSPSMSTQTMVTWGPPSAFRVVRWAKGAVSTTVRTASGICIEAAPLSGGVSGGRAGALRTRVVHAHRPLDGDDVLRSREGRGSGLARRARPAAGRDRLVAHRERGEARERRCELRIGVAAGGHRLPVRRTLIGLDDDGVAPGRWVRAHDSLCPASVP